MLSISVIIPTYKRNTSLLRTLASLQEQKLAILEIIVVDNASDSQLHDIVEKFNHSAFHLITYISEHKVGLHFARHAGAKESKAEVLIFTDDDATFSPDWVKAYIDAFDKYPDMIAAGGPVTPKWETNPATWLKEFIGESKIFTPLSLMNPYKKFRLDKKGYFFGVNMAIRRKTLFKFGGFNPELIGNIYVGDGEFGLIKKLWQKRLLIGYIPQAIVYHHIAKERMTLNYLKMRMGNEGISTIYSKIHPQIPNRGKLFILSFVKLLKNLKLFIASVVYKGKTDNNSLNIQLSAEHEYSQICYLLRLIFNKNLRSIVEKCNWLN